MANYFDEIPHDSFAEVESAVAGVEDMLMKVRAAMTIFVRGEVRDASSNELS
jgi:hypothetical protein